MKKEIAFEGKKYIISHIISRARCDEANGHTVYNEAWLFCRNTKV